jgi:dihydroorotase
MAAAALVSAAVDAGKLVPTQAETYKKLAMADYESTKLAIDSLPVQMSAKERIKGAAGDVALNQQKLAALSAKSFTELHRSGELEWLKLNAPDVYEAKYIEKFNKKPNA